MIHDQFPTDGSEPGSDRRSVVDLHLHSNRSDGWVAPAAVVANAKEAGLEVIALTDHDTVSGIEEADRAARELELELIPGIELSTYDGAGSTHLLGYYVDPENPDLLEYLEGARARRWQRAQEIVEKLNGLGLGVTFEDVVEQASGTSLIARPHIARALVAGGWVGHYAEAFARFIAAGRPAYVPTRHTAPADGIRRIQAAGGLAFLAHGGKSHGEAAISELIDAGLDGLEIFHPDHGPEEVGKLQRLAAEGDLLESGGSDWHGPRESRRGQLASQPVPYEWYLRLQEAAFARRNGA